MDKMLELFRDSAEYRRMTKEEYAASRTAEAENGKEDNDKIDASTAQKDDIKPEFSRRYILHLLKKGFTRYFIDAFTGMAQGLFCTLIAGTILEQIGTWISDAGTQAGMTVGGGIIAVASLAKLLMGAGIGIGIAHALKAPKLVMFTAAVAGLVGAFASSVTDGFTEGLFAAASSPASVLSGVAPGAPGNPIGAYVVSVLAVELGRLVAGKTKVDIVVVPLFMFVICIFAIWVAWPFIKLVDLIGEGVALATAATPAVMGIIIAVVMGILLTLPTSSRCDPRGHGVRDGRGGLRHLRRHTPRRRSVHGRMRRAYGRLRRPVLPREQVGRTHRTGHRHQHVADPQPHAPSADHASSHRGKRDSRTPLHLRLRAALQRRRRRHGHLRSCRHLRHHRRLHGSRHARAMETRPRHRPLRLRHPCRRLFLPLGNNEEEGVDKVWGSIPLRLNAAI